MPEFPPGTFINRKLHPVWGQKRKQTSPSSAVRTRFALSINCGAFLQTQGSHTAVRSMWNHIRFGHTAPPNSHPTTTHFWHWNHAKFPTPLWAGERHLIRAHVQGSIWLGAAVRRLPELSWRPGGSARSWRAGARGQLHALTASRWAGTAGPCSPPHPHARRDQPQLVQVLLICPGTYGLHQANGTEHANASTRRVHAHCIHPIYVIMMQSSNNWQNMMRIFFKAHILMFCVGIQFKLHSWKNAQEFLWFTQCTIPFWLGKFDAVLIINKVKLMFPYTCKGIVNKRIVNNDVSYCGDLTAWRPCFQLIIFSYMITCV